MYRVYPRVRGGTALKRNPGRVVKGLSPRARGNHLLIQSPSTGKGSIPACAGEPSSTTVSILSFRVYPRVRGGTSTVHPPMAFGAGLSPRARGNRANNRFERGLWGLSPRARGNHTVAGPQPMCAGSIPRARGNQQASPAAAHPYGSIPACAGEPLYGNQLYSLQFQRTRGERRAPLLSFYE